MNTSSGDPVLRKEQHLTICLDHSRYQVQTADTLLSRVHFYHRALPEIDSREISAATSVVKREVRSPLFISCMTGGSDEGYRLNQELARAAQYLKLAVGMGSMRILWKKPEVLEHFQLRKLAPDVPIFSNIGAVEVRDRSAEDIIEMNRRLEVDAQVIHLNPAQELFQPEGDRDFSGVRDALYRFMEQSPLPVIIKETGCGIHPDEVKSLLNAGAYAVDLAGSGGTNWISVEAYRNTARELERSRQFDDWGHPTALLLAALRGQRGIWSSGGLRNGMDAAKSLALGAEMAGLAMTFIEAARTGGQEGVISCYEDMEKTLLDVMLLTGSRDIAALKKAAVWFEPEFSARFQEYQAGLGGSNS